MIIVIVVLRPSWFTEILFWIGLLLCNEVKQLKIIIIPVPCLIRRAGAARQEGSLANSSGYKLTNSLEWAKICVALRTFRSSDYFASTCFLPLFFMQLIVKGVITAGQEKCVQK